VVEARHLELSFFRRCETGFRGSERRDPATGSGFLVPRDASALRLATERSMLTDCDEWNSERTQR
jgi:hypothetical protein